MWETWVRFLGWEKKGRVPTLQCSGLENSMDYIAYGVTKSWTPLRDHMSEIFLNNLIKDIHVFNVH